MRLIKKRRSIRGKIITLVLVIGLLPGVIFTFFSTYYNMANALSASIGADFQLVAKSLSERVSSLIEKEIDEVINLANYPSIVKLTQEASANRQNLELKKEITSYLEMIVKQEGDEYYQIVATDNKGNVLVSSLAKSQDNYSGEKWWQRAYNNGKGRPFIGDIHREGSIYTVHFTSPILLNNQTIGVMAMEVSLENLFNDVSKIQIDKNSHVDLFDTTGRIIAKPQGIMTGRLKKQLLNKVVLGKPGWVITEDEHGRQAVIGTAPVKIDPTIASDIFGKRKWYVMVPQELSTAHRPIFALILQIIAFRILIALIVLIIIFYLSYRISKPLSELRKAAQSVAEGDLDQEVNIRTNDEIEDLAEDFNIMVDKLRTFKLDLEDANKELEEANRLKSEFLANMSHELRTPLNSIIGFAEILSDQLFGKLNERQQKYTRNIHSSGQHLLHLINDILDLSKIDAGRLELNRQVFPVEERLNDILATLKPLASKKNLKTSISVDAALKTISADEAKFKQIMFNLLSNAIKFTPDNGSIAISARPDNDMALISVADTGIGIDKKDYERVFGQFQQLNGSASREYEGTGLGLALTKKLIELHGGTIWLKSKINRGTTFYFKIPIAPELPGLDSPSVYPTEIDQPFNISLEPGNDKPTILVIEDDPKASEILAVYLNESGYNVVQSFDGQDAVTKAEELQPFAVTLDVMLPNKDGWSVLKELKNNPKTKHIPVIMVSMVDDKELRFSLGAVDHFVKPINKKQLLDTLSRFRKSANKRFRPYVVLVVDNDEKSVELVSGILESEGFGILKAFDGNEAIKLATQNLPDLIILDLMMPGVSGFDVVKELRKHPEARNIPTVILTCKELTREDKNRLNGCIDRIMRKADFDRHDLLNEIFKLEKLDPDKAMLIDRATGLFNYRYFKKRLAEEINRAKRFRRSFSLILINIDNAEPDDIVTLRRLAALVEEKIRHIDPLARYGENQFILILPETTKSGAIKAAEKIRAHIMEHSFFEDNGDGQLITATIGVTAYYEDGSNSDELLNKLLTLVEEAKKAGGNKLVTC